MQLTPFVILATISLILAVVAIIKPSWPLLPVAVILICVALLIGK